VGSHKQYGFSRSQVTKRAPGLCDTCALRSSCPIEHWPSQVEYTEIETPTALKSDPNNTRITGPAGVVERRAPEQVWVTAESLSSNDPALASNPDLPVVFVFDEPLLDTLQLSAKRLVFITESLAELAQERDVELLLGAPSDVLRNRSLTVTHAPVPGFVRRAAAVDPAETHPWPWLVPPTPGSVASFSAWRKQASTP
jgi:deoxyribodipyrimidine photo-lyase